MGAGAAAVVAPLSAAGADAAARTKAKASDESGRGLIDRLAGGDRRGSLAGIIHRRWSRPRSGRRGDKLVAVILRCVMALTPSCDSVHTPACGGSARRPGEGERQR